MRDPQHMALAKPSCSVVHVPFSPPRSPQKNREPQKQNEKKINITHTNIWIKRGDREIRCMLGNMS